MLLGLVVALPLAVLARRFDRLETLILGASTIVYTIPSLAVVPAAGAVHRHHQDDGRDRACPVLVDDPGAKYLAGLRAVPDEVLESATGMGYGPTRMLLTVELPLAMPVIMAGLRVATVSTVALTTIGSIVSYGGLGNLLAEGVRQNFKAQILAASVLCVLLALVLDAVLLGAQRLLTPWTWKRG